MLTVTLTAWPTTLEPSAVKMVDIMSDAYPQLAATRELVVSVVEREEIQFRRTLVSGSRVLDEHLAGLAHGSLLDGSVAFLLHDTYGFPVEVTAEVVARARRDQARSDQARTGRRRSLSA